MSKRATISKATGGAIAGGICDQELLRDRAVDVLGWHISEAISSVSGARRKPLRSACAQVALQVLFVAVGLRRAALVDALALTAAQASKLSRRLKTVALQTKEAWWHVLDNVRFLYHEPTSQTFVLSVQQCLWLDAVRLKERPTGEAADHQEACPALWCDARSTTEHTAPTCTAPDSHILALIETVRTAAAAAAVAQEEGPEVLIVSGPEPVRPTAQADGTSIDPAEAQLVGIALAGFLLEYGAIYCLHEAQLDGRRSFDYKIQRLEDIGVRSEPSFASSPANCLGSQPLLVFRVMWTGDATSLELLSFSIPQSIIDDDRADELVLAWSRTFHDRLQRIPDILGTLLARLRSGRITVERSQVTLHQLAL